MFRSIWFLFLSLSIIVPINSDLNLVCSNGRPAFYLLDVTTFHISAHCPTSGQPCSNKRGKCNEQNICCPPTLK